MRRSSNRSREPRAKMEKRRRARPRPPGPWKEHAKAAEAAAIERAKERPIGPSVRAKKVEQDRFEFRSGYAGAVDDWWVMIADALGTRSDGVIRTFLQQLASLTSAETWHPDNDALNAALNIVASVKPANELEAMLAAQMVAVHWLVMKSAASSISQAWVDPRQANLTSKLARAFAEQAVAMQRLKGKSSSQKITVSYEKHVHQHVHQHLETRGGEPNFGGRAHGPNTGDGEFSDAISAIELEGRAALPGPDPAGDALSVPRDKGPEALPASRGAFSGSQRASEPSLEDWLLDNAGRGLEAGDIPAPEGVAIASKEPGS